MNLSDVGSYASIISLVIAVLAWRKADAVAKQVGLKQKNFGLINVGSPVTQTQNNTDKAE